MHCGEVFESVGLSVGTGEPSLLLELDPRFLDVARKRCLLMVLNGWIKGDWNSREARRRRLCWIAAKTAITTINTTNPVTMASSCDSISLINFIYQIRWYIMFELHYCLDAQVNNLCWPPYPHRVKIFTIQILVFNSKQGSRATD